MDDLAVIVVGIVLAWVIIQILGYVLAIFNG